MNILITITIVNCAPVRVPPGDLPHGGVGHLLNVRVGELGHPAPQVLGALLGDRHRGLAVPRAVSGPRHQNLRKNGKDSNS